jgi:hypothetical protein
MPQEMSFPPSAEDTDNSADTDCDREMSASTTPPLLSEQGAANNEPLSASTSSNADYEEQTTQEAATLSSSPSPEKQIGDATRVTFSPDTNGIADCHASMSCDDDKSKHNSQRRDDHNSSSSSQKLSSSSQNIETKTPLQEQEERIEHSLLEELEHPSSNTPERLLDPEGVMPSQAHSRTFSEDTTRKIVQAEEIPAPREKSPRPSSPPPMMEEPIRRSEKRVVENQQEMVDDFSPVDLSPETPTRKNMVLSAIRQEQEEPLSPLDEDDHLQLVNQSGGAEDPMMLHATLTSPPGSVAPAPHRTVAGPYNGYMQQPQQQQQQHHPLLQRMHSNSFHETTSTTQNPNQHQHPLHNMHPTGFPAMPPMMQIPPSVMMSSSNNNGYGKRKIQLRLMEESPHQSNDRKSFLGSFRRRPTRNSFGSLRDMNDSSMEETTTGRDRGKITVSWYEGTTSLELQEHVRRSVVRKMELRGTIRLKDMRILDESVHPPEGEPPLLKLCVYVCCGIFPCSLFVFLLHFYL